MPPRYGIGSASGRRMAAPTNAGNGSGGAGALPGTSGGFAIAGAIKSDVSDLTAGRVTLGLVNVTLLGLIAFYIWTRTRQGG